MHYVCLTEITKNNHNLSSFKTIFMALRSKNVSLIINVLAVNCNLTWLQQWLWQIQLDNDRIGMSLNISERVHLKGNIIYIITNTIVGTKYTRRHIPRILSNSCVSQQSQVLQQSFLYFCLPLKTPS